MNKPTLLLSYHSILCISILCIMLACQFNNIKKAPIIEDIFNQYGLEGSFMLMDNSKGEFIVYDITKDTARVLASNALILPYSLVALESGLVSKIKTPFLKNKNKSLHLKDIMNMPTAENGAILFSSLDKNTLSMWLDSIRYGNQMHLPSQTKISVDEQLGLVKKLYFKQLPFSNRSMQLIKNASPTYQQKNGSVLTLISPNAYKGVEIQWSFGWIEDGKNLYFFACHFKLKKEQGAESSPKKIVQKILNALSVTQTFLNLN